MRTIVGGEDKEGVVRQSPLLQLGHYLPHLHIKARNHSRKLCMGTRRGIVARSFVATKRFLFSKDVPVMLKQGVLGLTKFGMRQSIGEDAKERFVGLLAVEPGESLTMNDIG